MSTNLVRFAALALTMLSLTSCSSMVGPREQLASARVRWAQRGPDSYSMIVSRGCECPVESVGPATVTVENGAISVHYTQSGASVPRAFIPAFPDVEGLFDLIEDAQKQSYDKVDVEYDAELGYPTRISVDIDERAVDDEFGVYVRDFKSM